MPPHEFSEPPDAQSVEALGDANPYASPQAAGPLLAKDVVTEPVGVWRAGNVLIMHRAAELPSRCIVTNEPCDASERHHITLDSRWTILTLQATIGLIGGLIAMAFYFSNIPNRRATAGGVAVVGLLIMGLIALRKSNELTLSYSFKQAVQNRRLLLRNLGAVLGFLGLLLFVSPLVLPFFPRWLSALNLLLGFAIMFGGGIALIAGRFPLRIERPPGNYLLLHGAGREFVANFPQAAIGLPFLGRIFPKPLN